MGDQGAVVAGARLGPIYAEMLSGNAPKLACQWRW